jgi:hypothetical protein
MVVVYPLCFSINILVTFNKKITESKQNYKFKRNNEILVALSFWMQLNMEAGKDETTCCTMRE